MPFYRDLNGELDHRLPGDGYYGGSALYNGYNAGSDDPENGYDSENQAVTGMTVRIIIQEA